MPSFVDFSRPDPTPVSVGFAGGHAGGLVLQSLERLLEKTSGHYLASNFHAPFTQEDDVYGVVRSGAHLVARLSPEALKRYQQLRNRVENDDDDVFKHVLTEEEFAQLKAAEDLQ